MEAPESRLFIQCGCQNEVLVIEKDEELQLWYLSIFSQHRFRHPWWHRLVHIWNIIRYGNPYYDHIVLNEEDINKIKEHLK